MKLALLIDGSSVSRWQAEALLNLGPDAEFVVYSCTNSRSFREPFRHGLYYALRIAALSLPETASVSLPPDLRVVRTTSFDSGYDGRWQTLPQAVVDDIHAEQPAAIVKFGLGLLRVPSAEQLPIPILSYHHGDPRRFRGRPAGFYELLQGEQVVGQIVQRLGARLDAGAVLAFAETKAHPHSWRSTMREAYRASPLLLRAAVHNTATQQALPFSSTGRTYRLPSNWMVIRFGLQRASARLRRLLYGAFYEKAWGVAHADICVGAAAAFADSIPAEEQWTHLPLPSGYRFIADPFFHPEAGVLVEGLSSSSGLGQLVHLRDSKVRVLTRRGHFSYPATVEENGDWFLVPEMAEWSGQRLFRLQADHIDDLGHLDVPGCPRLIDPTMIRHEGQLYLFANLLSEGDGILRLWVGDSVKGSFREHPMSPVRMSPAGSRMAGNFIHATDGLVRPGQDLRGAYGDGVLLFRLIELSPDRFAEQPAGAVRFSGRRGPHTLNVAGETLLFDHYQERISPWAGLRRIQALAQRRRASPAT